MLWVRFLSKNCKTQALRSLSSFQFLPCSRFHRSLWFPGSSEQMCLKSLLILFYVICQYMSCQYVTPETWWVFTPNSCKSPRLDHKQRMPSSLKGIQKDPLSLTSITPEFILFSKHFTDIHTVSHHRDLLRSFSEFLSNSCGFCTSPLLCLHKVEEAELKQPQSPDRLLDHVENIREAPGEAPVRLSLFTKDGAKVQMLGGNSVSIQKIEKKQLQNSSSWSWNW